MLKKTRIHVEHFGDILCDSGYLFLEVLNRHGLDLHNDCGGHGKCGKCRIIVHNDPPEPIDKDRFFLTPEQVAEGYRLACFHQIREDCSITIPPPKLVELVDDL